MAHPEQCDGGGKENPKDLPKGLNRIFDNHALPLARLILISEDRKPSKSILLNLPLEIRSQIFGYLFSSGTIKSDGIPGVLYWIKGATALLVVSKQVHDEAATLLYNSAIFSVDEFCDYLEPSMIPRNIDVCTPYYSFKNIGKRYLPLIRNLDLGVYTGVISGLLARLSFDALVEPIDRLHYHVEAFCSVLRHVPEVERLCLFFDESFDLQILQGVLQRFFSKSSIRFIEVHGSVDPEVRDALMRWQAHVRAPGLSTMSPEPHTKRLS